MDMATIKEIASRAGVSIGTVDRVIHDRGRVAPEKREEILQIIEELGYKPNSVAQGLALHKKKLRFSFYVIDTSAHPFFEDVLAGARKKARELTQYGIEVDFYEVDVFKGPVDPANLQTDGIAMLPLTHLEPVAQWARQNNIPIVYFNMPVEDDYALGYVGCDYEQAGRIAAGLCAITTNGRGKVGILSEGDGSVASFQRRVNGFRREAEAHYPEMKIVGQYVTGDTMTLNTTARRMLREHPDLDVVYLINPGDSSACRLIRSESHNPNIKIITNDLTREQRPMVESGEITATICQEPERQGTESLELLFQYVANKQIPADKNCYTTLSIHISQNI